jgi:hypothetical protein
MITEKSHVAIILFGVLSQSCLWATDYIMQTIYEQSFDTEIEDVVYSSYEDRDSLIFYPKIVILKQVDSTLSQGEYRYHKREVQIYGKDGHLVHSIRFPFWTQVGCSENGNYFYAGTVIRKIPDPYLPSEVYYQEIEDAYFAVYDAQGDLLWKIPFEPVYDADYSFRVSPRDGSVIELLSTYFDSKGNSRSIRPLCGYSDFEIYGFSKNWQYIVAISYKYPEAHQSSIPGKSPEPRILLLDSLLNLVWERPLDEYNGYGAAVSPRGSYIYASSNTSEHQKTGIMKGGLVSSMGALFDQYGKLVMEIENGSYPIVFSENERCLLAMFYTPDDRQINEIGLIDIIDKKVLYKKSFRARNAVIAADGSVAILRRTIPEFDQALREGMSVREARIHRMKLDEQAVWKATVFDKEGTTLLETDGFASMGAKIVYDILHWDGTRLLLSVKDNTQNSISVLVIEPISK